MPKFRQPYPLEYKEQILDLVRSGRPIKQLAKEFEPSEQSIRNWVKQAELDEGLREDGVKSSEREELGRLRKENRRLRQERDILAKAAAWFARETDSMSEQSTDS